MGPSSTKGATNPALRKAHTNVVVFQCPQGAFPRQRTPLRERPRLGVMAVVAHVSSRNTKCWAFKPGCSAAQLWRA